MSPRMYVESFLRQSQQLKEDGKLEKRHMNYTFHEPWTPGNGPTGSVPFPNSHRS